MKRAAHNDPVWRTRSNFIIAARLKGADDVFDSEQIWARRVGDRSFEVCCIPFYAYDVALGDLVETDDQWVIHRSISRSGRYVFRFLFAEDAEERDEFIEELERRGALVERFSARLLSIDAPNLEVAEVIASFLAMSEHASLGAYETGATR